MQNKQQGGLLFVLPALVGTFIFIIIPIICSFALSFTEWDLLNPIKFVGFKNYKLLFNDDLFYKILINTVVFALSTKINLVFSTSEPITCSDL